MIPPTILISILALMGITSAAPHCKSKTSSASSSLVAWATSMDPTTSSASATSSSASEVIGSVVSSTMTSTSLSNTISSDTEISTSSTVVMSVGTSATNSAVVIPTTTSTAVSTSSKATATSIIASTTAKSSLSVVASTTFAAAASTASTKIGVSWPVQEIDAAPIAEFFTTDSQVTWWYDWNKNWDQGILTSSGVTIPGEFIPMLYDIDFYDNADPLETGWSEIMGYNEPDLTSSTGVSEAVTPELAAEPWKIQVTAIRAANPAAKIWSPAMASNKTWLEDFFAAICPDDSASNAWGNCDYAPDYVSMHIYSTDSSYFEGTVTDYHTSFGLPLVVAEWACYDFDFNPSPSASDVSTFMSTTMSWMNDQDWIVKYAWFGAARSSDYLYGVAETNRLLDTSGALTDLGKQYMAGGSA